ncbi:ORFL286W [Human betaherpesvirus 5]|nr:ORFL286W [Human betaherpesvirus 5]
MSCRATAVTALYRCNTRDFLCDVAINTAYAP